MNGWDILIIVILAAAVFFAVWLSVRRKKRGRSCCGDCAACGTAGGRGADVCPEKEKK